MPPPTMSGSPPPPRSPSETSSCRPRLLVFEQDGPSEKVLMVDLSSSSDEEGLIPDTSWDVEFTKNLFGDLNHDVLGPPGDDKIIILNDSSEEEEEVRKEKTIGAEDVPSFATRSPISTITTDTDDAPTGGEKR
jgi:hypothetical protein